MTKSFEDKLNDMLFGEEATERLKSAIGAHRSRSWEKREEEHREKVMKAMEANFVDKLFHAIAEKIAVTLEAEGPMDMAELRKRCDSVARLSDELLQKHLDFGVKEGYFGQQEENGAVRYHALKKV